MGSMDNSVSYSTVTITVKTGNKTRSIVIHKAKDPMFQVDEAFDKGILDAELTFEIHKDEDGIYYSGGETIEEK